MGITLIGISIGWVELLGNTFTTNVYGTIPRTFATSKKSCNLFSACGLTLGPCPGPPRAEMQASASLCIPALKLALAEVTICVMLASCGAAGATHYLPSPLAPPPPPPLPPFPSASPPRPPPALSAVELEEGEGCRGEEEGSGQRPPVVGNAGATSVGES